MKLVFLLMLCALAAAAPQSKKADIFNLEIPQEVTPESRNILVNLLVRQLINYVRRIVNNGSDLFGIAPLDPLDLEHFDLAIPENSLLDFTLALKNIHTNGLGGFVVHKSNLNLKTLTFDLDISVPRLFIKAGLYDILGHIFRAFPLYGNGKSVFEVEGFRFQALLFLKQSEDGESIILDKVENAAFQLPSFKAELTGIVGGGDIDKIGNALIEEVLIEYINRFEGAISSAAAIAAVPALNIVLEQLDTWKYISVLL